MQKNFLIKKGMDVCDKYIPHKRILFSLLFWFSFNWAIDKDKDREKEVDIGVCILKWEFHARERERDKGETTMLMRPYTSSKSL